MLTVCIVSYLSYPSLLFVRPKIDTISVLNKLEFIFIWPQHNFLFKDSAPQSSILDN